MVRHFEQSYRLLATLLGVKLCGQMREIRLVAVVLNGIVGRVSLGHVIVPLLAYLYSILPGSLEFSILTDLEHILAEIVFE